MPKLPYMPWLSFAPPLERAFIEERHESLSRLDKCVAVPWVRASDRCGRTHAALDAGVAGCSWVWLGRHPGETSAAVGGGHQMAEGRRGRRCAGQPERPRRAAAATPALPVVQAALWLSILRRHWHAMTAQAVMRSFCHFMVPGERSPCVCQPPRPTQLATNAAACCCRMQVIISPSYLQLVLGRRAYLQHRVAIIGLALTSYVLHPGGGLYRDAMMQSPQDSLAALSLFVRLLVGSRTLFWLVLRWAGREGRPLLLASTTILAPALGHCFVVVGQ